jgi:hypothetical protein
VKYVFHEQRIGNDRLTVARRGHRTC